MTVSYCFTIIVGDNIKNKVIMYVINIKRSYLNGVKFMNLITRHLVIKIEWGRTDLLETHVKGISQNLVKFS